MSILAPVEADPNGLSPSAPGAKLDYGKPRTALALLGFLPALDALLASMDGGKQPAAAVLTAAAKQWPRALEAVAEVTTAGAAKYTPNGWADVPDGINRYLDAYGRHLLKVGAGELLDGGEGGTGCRHDAQMCWNLLAAVTLHSIQTPRQSALAPIAFGGGPIFGTFAPSFSTHANTTTYAGFGAATYDAARFLPFDALVRLASDELDKLEAALASNAKADAPFPAIDPSWETQANG